MDWSDVGKWLKTNAGSGAALVGSLLTGNVPAAVAAGVALVSSATGEAEPSVVLQRLQSDPASIVRLRELAVQEQQSIRDHVRAMAELQITDQQREHAEQQTTIRSGDQASDEYVRHTRPMMARQSWYVTALYVVGFEAAKAGGAFSGGASVELALLLLGPAAAYLGFRSLDKRAPGAATAVVDAVKGAVRK